MFLDVLSQVKSENVFSLFLLVSWKTSWFEWSALESLTDKWKSRIVFTDFWNWNSGTNCLLADLYLNSQH